MVSCQQVPTSTSGDVEHLLVERAQVASAALHAANEIGNLNPDKNIHTEVVGRETSVAIANLPHPTDKHLTLAMDRAFSALKMENEQLARLYAVATSKASELESQLVIARQNESKLAAERESNAKTLASQVKILTWASIGLIGIGILLNVIPEPFTQRRIGFASAAFGGVLIFVTRMILMVPNWVYHVFSGALILLCVAVPVFMYWSYRTGLFQKPPEKVGDFQLN